MKKILIATKNKDKFSVVTKILDKISKEEYQYYSLYDINNIKKEKEENGDIKQRAYDKANQIRLNLLEDGLEYEYIIGIDDGIEMKGTLRENVKDYIKDIIDDKYLTNGEQINIIRAYCFMKTTGEYDTVLTKIPFKYKKLNKSILIEENTYPLKNVLTPITSDKTVAEIGSEESNQYYLRYSEKEIKNIFEV